MGVFKGLFGKGREVRAAKRAELRGDLAKAVELYGLAGAPEEAARVMLLRGDSENDPQKRMQHYTQAVAIAPDRHAVKNEARKKRAELVIGQFPAGAASPQVKRDILTAAKDLELAGENMRAAEVYARLGDAEGEARALAQSGDVERLEALLTDQQATERAARRRVEEHAQIEMFVQSGRRREALALATGWLEANPDDRAMRDRAQQLKSRRVTGPVASLSIRGEAVMLVLGSEVTIGRTEGTLIVSSHAVSRQHLRIEREAGGAPVVRDLGSRNGTQLRGMNVVGVLRIDGPIELMLGKEVRVALAPSKILEGAVTIELGGTVYVAPLGPAKIPGTRLTIEEGEGHWVELCAEQASPPLMGETACVVRSTLLLGDAFASERGGETILRVVGA